MLQRNRNKQKNSWLAQWCRRMRERTQQAYTYTRDHYEELHRRQKYYAEETQAEQENTRQPERITMLTAIRILLAELGEKEYWRTLWHLIWRPGYVIADFLNGKRRRFLRPFALLIGTSVLLAAALYIVPAEIKSEVSYEEFMSQRLADVKYTQDTSPEDIEVINKAGHKVALFLDAYDQWTNEHIDLGLLVKSIWVVVFTWLLFRKSPRKGCPYIEENTDGKKANYNFAEILTAEIFIISQLQMLNVAWVLATGWFVPYIDFHPYAYPYLLANIIVFIDYQQLFCRKWYSTLWRTLLALLFMF